MFAGEPRSLCNQMGADAAHLKNRALISMHDEIRGLHAGLLTRIELIHALEYLTDSIRYVQERLVPIVPRSNRLGVLRAVPSVC